MLAWSGSPLGSRYLKSYGRMSLSAVSLALPCFFGASYVPGCLDRILVRVFVRAADSDPSPHNECMGELKWAKGRGGGEDCAWSPSANRSCLLVSHIRHSRISSFQQSLRPAYPTQSCNGLAVSFVSDFFGTPFF